MGVLVAWFSHSQGHNRYKCPRLALAMKSSSARILTLSTFARSFLSCAATWNHKFLIARTSRAGDRSPVHEILRGAFRRIGLKPRVV